MVGQLCSDPTAVESGKTSCSREELEVTRELILFNFNRWRDRVRALCSSEAQLEEKVIDAVFSTSQYFLFHAAGLIPGEDKQGEIHDLAIYTLFLDIRVIVVHADAIRADSTEKQLSEACIVAGFEGECEKRRVVCAVLEKGHYDLGVVFRPEAHAVFENGPEWETARSLILHYLRARKAKPQPKVFWTPSAPRFPVSAPTPNLNALRQVAKITPVPARLASTSAVAPPSATSPTSTATSTTTLAAATTSATAPTTAASAPTTTTATATTTAVVATAIPRTSTDWVLTSKKA